MATRLDALIAGHRWAADVEKMRAAVPSLFALPPGFIEYIWERFSEDHCDAGWLDVDETTLRAFGLWLGERVYEKGTEP